MKNTLDHTAATFTPQLYKSFDGALEAFFASECPQIGGIKTRQVLVTAIRNMIDSFFPATNHLRSGQTIWSAVHKHEESSYGKTITKSRLTPVILDLLPQEEIKARSQGTRLRDIKREATARLFQQAYAQDGVLTNAEVALLLKISPSTVGKYIAQWEIQNSSSLPRRGTIHDMGPTLTHKKEILQKLIFEGKSVECVCRETKHSPEAVLRYTNNFKQVLLCRRKGLSHTEISFATKLSIRLIEEYHVLIDQYSQKHPLWECNGQPWLDTLIDKLEHSSKLVTPNQTHQQSSLSDSKSK
jgi:DNA-binding CsgD family transcriptional regulator